MSDLKDTAWQATKDAELLEEMVLKLRALDWEISACGRRGMIEHCTVEELAPKVIKAMANYI